MARPRRGDEITKRIIDLIVDPELAGEAVHRHFDEVRERANAGSYGGFGAARPTVA